MSNGLDLASLDLNLLVLFEAVMAERHVGRAATRLHLTSSAVSHGLNRLRRLLADPLFLRTPKGVVPTARADELAPQIADILARVRRVIESATPFDPATSARRFTIGAPDSVAVVLLPALLRDVQVRAPAIDVSIRHLLPHEALGALELRSVDLAIAQLDALPARFHAEDVYVEDFVIAARIGHPFLKAPTLDHYCTLRHVLVSVSGDAHGFLDDALAAHGRSRRIALVVPHFMLALAALVDTDLVTALPRSFATHYAARFGVGSVESPMPTKKAALRAITLKSAVRDAGLAWLRGALTAAAQRVATAPPRASQPRTRARR
jgi:DNA-binding transcriptional LysR family regulator